MHEPPHETRGRGESSGMPRISIVTPSYNQGRFLDAAMRSVLEQGYPDLEYIVVDGGSTDESRAIIERHAARLHWWASEPDQGHAHALNKGFARSTGEIMAWLNSDDLYLPWAFRVVAEIFTRFPEVEWITGLDAWWNDRGELTRARLMPRNVHDYLLGSEHCIQQESVFWRRSLWDRVGARLDEGMRYMVDTELWCRFFPSAPLHSVECILAGYRVHGANRALVHHAECARESAQAVARLRERCSSEVLGLNRVLERARRFRTGALARVLPAQRINRMLRAGAIEQARYPTIVYGANGWERSSLPFTP